MNAARLTNADLDDWSRRRDSEGHLPTLVRRLIMASVRPTWIRMPAAEGVALAGLDGVVTVSGGAPPYVPAGDSVWELGTNEKRRAKATSDYDKRTAETPEDDRKHITYVCVLSRKWGSGEKWITEMKARGDEWKDIIVLAADELALWLESCPGVEAWLREHLGKSSLGDIGIDDWFTRWSRQTQPATPAALLTAGRRKDVIRVLNAFDTSPDSITVAAASVEEAVAFIAAALLLGPEPLPQAPPAARRPLGKTTTLTRRSPIPPSEAPNISKRCAHALSSSPTRTAGAGGALITHRTSWYRCSSPTRSPKPSTPATTSSFHCPRGPRTRRAASCPSTRTPPRPPGRGPASISTRHRTMHSRHAETLARCADASTGTTARLPVGLTARPLPSSPPRSSLAPGTQAKAATKKYS